MSGCAPLPPTIPCKCKKKKRERERERQTQGASRAWGCRVQHLYRKPAPPCADAPGNAVQFIFLFNFCSISLLHLFSKMFLFGERAQLQSPRCSAILPPTEPACNMHPPPFFPGLQNAPVRAGGAQGNTRVRKRVSACPWSVTLRAMAMSHPLTCESAHPDCAPGSEFSRTPTPGAGLADTPQVRRPWRPARGRDAGTRCLGTCVYPYAAETRVLG